MLLWMLCRICTNVHTESQLDRCRYTRQNCSRTDSVHCCSDVVLRCLKPRKASIRPDLLLSQMIATFETITKASPLLAQICRILFRWLGPSVSVHPIAAHKGHPWNELADAVAKWAAQQDPNCLPHWSSPGLHSLAHSRHDLQWCWMQARPIVMPAAGHLAQPPFHVSHCPCISPGQFPTPE